MVPEAGNDPDGRQERENLLDGPEALEDNVFSDKNDSKLNFPPLGLFFINVFEFACIIH